MWTFFRKARARPANAEAHRERKIRFLGEQDGPIGQQIKDRWKSILAAFPGALRAYLAIAAFGSSDKLQVVLCIRSATGDDPALMEALVKPFREIFSSSTALDITFLNEATEAEVKACCRAFYESA